MALGRVLFWKVTNKGSNLLFICEFNIATTFVFWQNLTLTNASHNCVLTYINQTSTQPQLTSDLCFFYPWRSTYWDLVLKDISEHSENILQPRKGWIKFTCHHNRACSLPLKPWLVEAKNAVWSLVLDTVPQRHSQPNKSTFPGAPDSEVLQQLLLCMCTCFVHFSLLREQNYRSKKMTNLLVTKLWCFTF